MNALALRGLFRDAVLQVLDNRVFRVLLILTLVPVLATFIIGLGETSFSLFFGAWDLDYPDFLYALGDEPRVYLVELFRTMFVDELIGSVGITICVAATAFFVPLMLEKGSADLVFTKPLSRSVLYLSRFVTGLVFIGSLSLLLNLGIFLGIGLRSGLWYPGILWSTLTLIYVFSLVHGFTMLIGVLTKSTPAAMILGIMFFMFNGCVHGTWQTVEAFGTQLDAVATNNAAETEEEAQADDKWEAVKDAGRAALNGAHYVLPKTTEASDLMVHLQAKLGFDRSLAAREEFNQSSMERRNKRQEESFNPETMFSNRFGFDAEDWRYNAWFSLLSSLGFVAFVLGIGCWRISRLDL